MSVLLPYLLAWLQEYGYPVLWLSVFVAAVGIPLPTSLVLLAAGAFAALGDFNVIILALIAVSASVCGDSLGYLIGWRWGSRVLVWLEQHGQRFISSQTIARSRMRFQRQGGWAIFLSRFLFSALGGVVNLFAGMELYPYRRFLPYDIAGESLGAILPLGLGFIFGAAWEAVGDILGAISLLFLALLLAIWLTTRLLAMTKRLKATAHTQVEQKGLATSLPGRQAKATPGNSGSLPL